MGVHTTADQKRDDAKEHLDKAYNCLLEVLDSNTWGNSDFKEEYLENLEEVAFKILKLKRKL